MRIIDSTLECSRLGNQPRLRNAEIDTIVVHRFGPEIPEWPKLLSAADIARAFGEHPDLHRTIGRMPYHFVVWDHGITEQAVAVRYQTPHAKAWNHRSVGVALFGDFRETKINAAQFASAAVLCRALCSVYTAQLKGHDELPGGSSDADKVCPGAGAMLADLKSECSFSPPNVPVWA